MLAVARDELTAVVLAGGAGRRFGGDKPGAPFAGTTLLGATVGAAQAVSGRVLVVGKDVDDLRRALAGRAAELVVDASREWHPLAGVVAGLRATSTPWALVLPCDAPLLQERLVAALIAHAPADVSAVVARWQDRVQPFPGLYRPTLASVAADLLAHGRSMQAFIASIHAHVLPEDAARAADAEGLSFLDADTPEALADLDRRR